MNPRTNSNYVREIVRNYLEVTPEFKSIQKNDPITLGHIGRLSNILFEKGHGDCRLDKYMKILEEECNA